MPVSRRRFLQLAGVGAAGICSYSYLGSMRRPPYIEGKVLADLHTHPDKESDLEDILELLSWGVTGLARVNNVDGFLTYDDALKLPKVKEIDKGVFAEISFNGSKGYFVKTQEVMSDYHILAVGCEGNPIQDHRDPRRTVEEIHNRGGLAILNHPYVARVNSWVRYRLINRYEEEKVRELCEMVDEVEVFNAQCINFFPLFSFRFLPEILRFNDANTKAKELASGYGFKGVASSDAHFLLDQVKIAGIYVLEDNLSIEALKYYIRTGNFDRYEKHASRWGIIREVMEFNQHNI